MVLDAYQPVQSAVRAEKPNTGAVIKLSTSKLFTKEGCKNERSSHVYRVVGQRFINAALTKVKLD